ncbi:hypothetical protein E2C01_035240 [Portunus trituberculatus]|uniref:Uncharacterized protein n=1 Tax=Portunus trituberculatus TaxID=210409 RepID=A0A5B7F8U2_PORTR|nr:hypothetical protein [Portunus trituberculatus]
MKYVSLRITILATLLFHVCVGIPGISIVSLCQPYFKPPFQIWNMIGFQGEQSVRVVVRGEAPRWNSADLHLDDYSRSPVWLAGFPPPRPTPAYWFIHYQGASPCTAADTTHGDYK